ncbi:MAG: DUF1178 family protein [Gammaproteobacteria bacterium]|nr:DUF1178 family protein [Gammaproteobacteria bacterium]MBU1414825.1 DUF1178 family protein [Gammaproteobacteria bacterium]
MIVLDLICIAGHRFDGWFATADAFEDQIARDMVNCPHCNTTDVQRLPSGPHVVVARPRSKRESASIAGAAQVLESLRQIAESSEDVGDLFADEARRIHHDEAPLRNIKGQATGDEVRDLLEDGIPVLPVPGKKTHH